MVLPRAQGCFVEEPVEVLLLLAAVITTTTLGRQLGHHTSTYAAGTQGPTVSYFGGCSSYCYWSLSSWTLCCWGEWSTISAFAEQLHSLSWTAQPILALLLSLMLPCTIRNRKKKKNQPPTSASHWQNPLESSWQGSQWDVVYRLPAILPYRGDSRMPRAKWQIASPEGLKGKSITDLWILSFFFLARLIYLAHPLSMMHSYKYILYTYF